MRTFTAQSYAEDVPFLTAQERSECVWQCAGCWDDFVGLPYVSIAEPGQRQLHYCDVCHYRLIQCECCG